jgi:hypothetical protein
MYVYKVIWRKKNASGNKIEPEKQYLTWLQEPLVIFIVYICIFKWTTVTLQNARLEDQEASFFFFF